MSWQSAKPMLIGLLVYLLALAGVKSVAGMVFLLSLGLGAKSGPLPTPMVAVFYLYLLLERCIPAVIAGYFVSRQDSRHPMREAFIVGFVTTSALSMIDMSGQSSWGFLHVAAFGLASGAFGALGAALHMARKAQPGKWFGLRAAVIEIMTPRREDIRPAMTILGSAVAVSVALATMQPLGAGSGGVVGHAA